MFFGIDGIIYTGPVADLLAAVVAIAMTVYEFKLMKNEDNSRTEVRLYK